MKTLEFKPGLPDSLLIRLEADVASKIRALFARCPTLHGFSVQDRAMLPRDLDQTRIPDADLFVTEIGVLATAGSIVSFSGGSVTALLGSDAAMSPFAPRVTPSDHWNWCRRGGFGLARPKYPAP